MKKDKILLEKMAKQIRKHRKINNLTQIDLAEKINVHENTIKNFEKGKTIPTIKDLLAITEILQISISSLFEDEKIVKYPFLKETLLKEKPPLAKENIKENINAYDLLPKGSQYYLLKRKDDYFLIDSSKIEASEEELYAIALTEEQKITLGKIKSKEYIVAIISLENEIKLYRKSEISILGKIVKRIKNYSL